LPIITGGTNYRLGAFLKDGKPIVKEGYVTLICNAKKIREKEKKYEKL